MEGVINTITATRVKKQKFTNAVQQRNISVLGIPSMCSFTAFQWQKTQELPCEFVLLLFVVRGLRAQIKPAFG